MRLDDLHIVAGRWELTVILHATATDFLRKVHIAYFANQMIEVNLRHVDERDIGSEVYRSWSIGDVE